MALYLYRCPEGHDTELRMSMFDPIPETVDCGWGHDLSGHPTGGVAVASAVCATTAKRVFTKPMVPVLDDHDRRFRRRRRPNPGDDLPL